MEGLVNLEAGAGDRDRRRERRGERHPPEAREGLLPQARRPGYADAEAARHALCERDRLPGRGVDEAVPPERLRSGLASVEAEDAAIAGAVDRHEAAAADAAREGLDDSQYRGGCDSGVDGRAAAAEHTDRRLRRERVDARRRSTGADCGRLSGRCRRRRDCRFARLEHGGDGY